MFTCDFDSDIGKVRALTGDTDQTMFFIHDEQITCYLGFDVIGGDHFLAAALCLEAMANNAAVIQQKIKSLDIQTDGPSVAKALKESAASLREQATNSDNLENFDIALQEYTPAQARDYERNLLLFGYTPFARFE